MPKKKDSSSSLPVVRNPNITTAGVIGPGIEDISSEIQEIIINELYSTLEKFDIVDFGKGNASSVKQEKIKSRT